MKAGGEPRCSGRLGENPGAQEGWGRTQVLRKAGGEPRCSGRLGRTQVLRKAGGEPRCSGRLRENPGAQESWR